MLPPSGSSGLRPAWWQRLRFVYRHADLRPSNQLSPISAGRHPTYKVSGDDPQFRLRHILPAGWYMVEVELHCEHVVGHSRFYLDHGHGESEALSHGLPCRNGKVSKRLLYLKSPARLRYDPVTAPCLLEVRHFRLVRMTPGAALQRLRRKLENHRTLVGGAWPSDDDLEAAWSAYDGLFSQDAGTTSSYASWIQQVEQPLIADLTEQRRTVSQWARRPLVSIVLPTWNTPVPLLRACLDSVLAQSYPHWELCVADDASTEPHVRRVLSAYASRDERIRVTYRPRNGHICEASNTALEMAGGEFVALLDHDDVLAPHALFFMVRALQEHPEARLVYSDEDKLDSEGRRCDPFFKPDWSPDLLRAQNYICHLCMLQRQLVKTVGGFRAGYEGSQDYDLVLRCTEHLSEPGQIVHVPMVLYHWRQTEGSTAGGHQAKDYATGAAVRALEDHMQRTRTGARVSVIAPGLYRSHWPLPPAPPLVSLIIPTRDAHDVLRTCIESILGKTTYPHLELLVVDNQSTCQQTMSYLDELTRQEAGRVRVLRHDQPFNYSAINNMAARHAKGSILGLINNDIEVISPDWLSEMVSHAVRPDVGCVGAKLYYPDRTVQHAGVVLGIGGVAGHSHKYFPGHADGYFGRLRICHNVSAVTGAVLVLRKDLFEQVGGLNEEALAVTFNDVDLCLRVSQAGFRHVWTPFAELLHHESKTRGSDTSPEKQARFAREREYMVATWGSRLYRDPHYNPNLTLTHEDYGLSTSPPRCN